MAREKPVPSSGTGHGGGILPGSAAPGWPRVSLLQGEVFAPGAGCQALGSIPREAAPLQQRVRSCFHPSSRSRRYLSPAAAWTGVPVTPPAAAAVLP